ncbi:AAA family ATPase [Mesorhizobium sp.]|uniref:AAA family ATPase n=1 Tax=Mesorhizobium sp. TaxID=1871066 RepID=UPI000FE347ED|nr:AAA family ATPase [Mesorhizobium sp.]RWG84886.1 MAG: hypothetical protein EOQ69_10060 [Mesorhizobium sp.]RWG90124.1 MAG: hypothetical protein EOQ70_05880 [Mesorhizobium sp.]RWK05071.1 MAG: hypothetical protein EOR42_15050 [Mesorhizobium sp.]RWK08955.1 MAG: hypothetical protein EOR39_18405 [Mesorhizobium sp.]RWK19871.1 MAG: hypothetical protein EOR41_08850 [Mesorhizobium sp.]
MTSHTVRDLVAGLPPSEARALHTDIRFVEFFGLPGIGKTTASSLMAKSLQRCGPLVGEVRIAGETRTFIGRQIYRIGIVIPRFRDPEFRSLVGRIGRFVIESGQMSLVDVIKVTWNLCSLIAYIEDERTRKNSIIILDQGLLQGFWSIFLKSKNRTTSEKWLDILSSIGMHDMIFVHLRGGADIARDRLLTRSDRSSRMQRKSADSYPDLWSAADHTCREMAADLEREMRAEDHSCVLAAVDVDRLASPEDVAERALEAVLLACLDRHRLCDMAGQ